MSLCRTRDDVKACLVMAGRFLALVILLSGSFSAIVNGKCPCEDQSLCEPIARPPGKEFLMFSTKPNVWRKYDWTKVTTIALFRPWDDELMCEAHKRVTNQSIYLSVILLTFFAGLLSW
jgi:di-N-acetylchitobiase